MENKLLLNLLFLAITSTIVSSTGDLHQQPADNLYSVIYWGDPNVTVGHAFWIRCIVPSSERVDWYKDGEPIEKHRRHHGKDDFVFEIQEKNKIGDPNKKEAKLTVIRAIPRHEGRYQCNNLHANSHYVRVHHGKHHVVVTTPNWDINDELEEEKNEEFHKITTNEYLEHPSLVSDASSDEIFIEKLLTTPKPLILEDKSDEDFPESNEMSSNTDLRREFLPERELMPSINDFDRTNIDYDQSSSREDMTTLLYTTQFPLEQTTTSSLIDNITTNNNDFLNTFDRYANAAPSLITFVDVTYAPLSSPLPPALPSAQTFDKIPIQNGIPDVLTALYDIPGKIYKTYKVNNALVLGCSVTIANATNEVVWKKGETEIKLLPAFDNRHEIIKPEGKFIVALGSEQDAGNYSCSYKNETKEFEVLASVYVKLPSNINVVENEKLTILCGVSGTQVSIKWLVNDKEINDSRITFQSDDRGVENAKLIIEKVELEDRAKYTCIGSNPVSSILLTPSDLTSSTLVRVKGKLAALWPFLGICAEVFVLCAIILIYEKRRNKTEQEDSDTDQSPDQKNDHGKDSDVRHRK